MTQICLALLNVTCNISQLVLFFSQGFKGHLHPVAFLSREMNKHEISYVIQDKELLSITKAFKEWHRYLEGARYKISVYMDYRGLEWFTQNKPLKQR